MAKNTGEGHRKGSVDNRTQIKNPKTDEFVKRNQDPNSEHEGEFMDVKEDDEKFKGVAEEPDDRRKNKISSNSFSVQFFCAIWRTIQKK